LDTLFFEDYGQIFLPLSVYLVLVLAVLTYFAFRRDIGHRLTRWRYVLLLLLVWSYLGNMPLVANSLVNSLEGQYPVAVAEVAKSTGDHMIVVLSTGDFRRTKSGIAIKLNASGWERTKAAVDLWKRIGGTIVFSGLPIGEQRAAVARQMAYIATIMGVNPNSILVEEEARNTYENIQNAVAMIKDPPENVWLVTSAINMPRAMGVAKKLGFKAKPYPSDFHGQYNMGWTSIFPNNSAAANLQLAGHEYIGIFYYWLRGRL